MSESRYDSLSKQSNHHYLLSKVIKFIQSINSTFTILNLLMINSREIKRFLLAASSNRSLNCHNFLSEKK